MKLKDKLVIARELAAVALEGFDFLIVAEDEDLHYLTDTEKYEIHSLITNAIAGDVRDGK